MYCIHCGKEIDENSKFCQYCGQAVASDKDNNAIDTPVVNNVCAETLASKLKNKKWIFVVCGVLAIILIAIFALGGNNGVAQNVEKMLEDDLGTSVTIIKLYYNEEKQGCLVEFTSNSSRDIAAVHLDTGNIEYQSEFDYYSERAEQLRKQKPINEQELRKCNQKILECSDLIGWKFTLNTEGATEENGWDKLK